MAILKSVKMLLKLLGALLVCILIFFFGCVFFPYSDTTLPQHFKTVILIKNINIIDIETDSILRNHHVRIINGIIDSISDKPISPNNDSANVIDGTSKYLISGLWDMHVHLMKQSPFVAYPKFIRHGVTHVRDMRGAYNDRDPFAGVAGRINAWNNQVKDRQLIGPEVHGYASFAVDGPSQMFKNSPKYFNCSTPGDAIKLVKYFKDNNISLIKIYDNISPQAFFTLMNEARKSGIDVAGHKPVRVSTIEASNAGMKSMEHGRFFIWDSFAGSENLQNDPDPKSRDNTQLRKKMLVGHDTVMLNKIFQAFVRNNTWYCPTHLTRKADAFADDSVFRKRYQDINPILKLLSVEDLDATIQEDSTPEGRQVYKDFYFKGLEISGQAARYGVKILAGSDLPELPGSSLHDELVELSKAGLPPFEVLRTTTLYPATYYGMSDKYGSIKKGKVADLVILSKNPINDIHNIKKIHGVVNNGVFLNSSFISNIENQATTRDKGIIMTCKLTWDVLISMTL